MAATARRLPLEETESALFLPYIPGFCRCQLRLYWPSTESRSILLAAVGRGGLASFEREEADAVAAVQVAAGARTAGVDGAEPRGGIEGDTGSVALLVHAARAIACGDELFRHTVARSEFHHEMAALAATGAERKIRIGRNSLHHDSSACE